MNINDRQSLLPILNISGKMRSATPRPPRTIYIVLFILVVGIIVTLINVFELRAMQREHYQMKHSGALPRQTSSKEGQDVRPPTFWVRANNPDSGYLNHIYNVLDRFGFDRTNDGLEDEWDLLWHHDYPFLDPKMHNTLHNLKPGQKVNHVPGSGFYTSKVNLATSNISGIPPAFSLPAEKNKFIAFASAHPDKFWVQKSNNHRGVIIKQMHELDLGKEDSFIQEYISNPLLIDGRKFDIGIYTMITSSSPLRVYVFDGDALLRFCPEDYAPFDPKNPNKYVVGDEYTPTWEIPSLKPFYTGMNLNFKQSLNAYIRNFFELSRFDFVLDEDLNVYLMEANMSPNLSSGHFVENKYLYEQVLFNLFSVVGVAGMSLHASNNFMDSNSDWTQMRAPNKQLMVYPELCANEECTACSLLKCQLCHHCMSPETLNNLRRAYDEHVSRQNTRRLIPESFESQVEARNFETFQHRLKTALLDQDQLTHWWFRGKCLIDVTWC